MLLHFLAIMSVWVNNALEKEEISEEFSSELSAQIAAMESNISRLSNCYFMNSHLHLRKRTTSGNEGTHRQYKYGDDKIKT